MACRPTVTVQINGFINDHPLPCRQAKKQFCSSNQNPTCT